MNHKTTYIEGFRHKGKLNKNGEYSDYLPMLYILCWDLHFHLVGFEIETYLIVELT